MTFEQAAATPQAGLLALQALRKRAIQPGDRVLVNGAGGGVGTFAIQLAKSFGAEVTGVDVERKDEAMRSAGADHVIDHTSVDSRATASATTSSSMSSHPAPPPPTGAP